MNESDFSSIFHSHVFLGEGHDLFSNGHCRPPPLVGGRLLPWDFWYPLIPEGREARLNDSRVHLLIRAPLNRRRNSTESYIVHYCLPSDRCPHGGREHGVRYLNSKRNRYLMSARLS